MTNQPTPQADAGAARFRVLCLRFSNDVPGMQRFLEAVGLRPTLTSDGGGWAVMPARGGVVALHSAADSDTGTPAGVTSLNLWSSLPADVTAEQLQAAGLKAEWWDESYGKQAKVLDPFGADIWVTEDQTDTYGYREHDVEAMPALSVTAVRYSHDFAADREFFGALGFRVDGHADDDWTPLVASDTSGTIGLHRPEPGDTSRGTDHVDLSFTTAEPLQQIRERLVAAGFADADIRPLQYLGDVLFVTDADGVAVQIHPEAQSHAAA